jgi:hypothetical protein
MIRPHIMYYVMLNKWRTHSNFIATASLGRARYFAKKLKRKYRQIDVRERGKKPYVLHNSWL